MASKKKKHTPKQTKKKMALPYWIGFIFLAAAMIAHFLLVIHYDFTQDDAFITFRYAANYLEGHGLVYNIGEQVEGYTNFLWTILMIIGGLSGIAFNKFSQVLGTACGLGTIFMLFKTALVVMKNLPRARRTILAGLSCLVLGLVYSFAYWTIAGLETAAFALMVISSLYFYMRRSYMTIPTLVIATLLRPEGGLVFVFILACEIISNKSLTRYALVIFGTYALFLIPHAVFKLSYYGSLFPNPFFAKTSFNIQQVIYGLEYTGEFFWHYLAAGIFILPAIILIKKLPREMKITMAFLLVYTLYITFIGGDVLKVHRFFVPLFPLFALVAVVGLYEFFSNKAFFVVTVAVLIGWQVTTPRDHVETFHRREKGLALKMILLMNNLTTHDKTNFSVAASTIGMVGYKLMGHTVIDLLGLTDSTIARHPEPAIEGLESTWKEMSYNSAYLLSRQPDYIIFSTGVKPSAPAERALFLYSAFLNNYRSIGYFLGAKMHSAFKRYGPIEGTPVRDVDVNFVQSFNDAVNMIKTDPDQLRQALILLDKTLKYSPDPVFPYVYYYMSEANRKLGNLEASYACLNKAAAIDTLTYEVYKDLYFFEYRLGKYDLAEKYRSITASLVPWYIPRLDSLVKGIN